jgi:hypothetical protein
MKIKTKISKDTISNDLRREPTLDQVDTAG